MTTTVRPVRAPAHPPKRKELVARLESNWRATWTAMVPAVEGGSIKPIHRGLLVRTGLPISFLNTGFVDAGVRRPDRVVAAAESYFAGLPFSVLVREDDVDLALACENAGLGCVETLPGMALTPIPVADVDPRLTIEPLTRDLLGVCRDVFCEGFGVPLDVGARMITHDYLECEGVYDVVAFVDDEPVAIATSFESMGVAGVYNVATLPRHRGNGYGDAVTWSVIQAAKSRGCHTATLQSTEMGFPVYRRMGFEVVSRYSCYTNDPRA
ncbi:MAG TPA: GNAT family N-acetyltransferase [Actinomycetota bacterium]|nr:GNAT family N-acetyltransferase [Actinomycetota bacterium]